MKDKYKYLPHFDSNIIVRGIYIRKSDNRNLVYEKNVEKKTFCMKAYARYLVEQHLERFLKEEEEVDHIDRIRTNDNIENLQIVLARDHRQIDSLKAKKILFNCVFCNQQFLKAKNTNRWRRENGHAGPFCSKKCVMTYASQIRSGEISKLPPQELIETDLEFTEKKKIIPIQINQKFQEKLELALKE